MSDVKGKKRVEKHEEEQSEEDDDEEEEVETETTTKEAVTIETNEKITFESLGLDASICKACEALNWKVRKYEWMMQRKINQPVSLPKT